MIIQQIVIERRHLLTEWRCRRSGVYWGRLHSGWVGGDARRGDGGGEGRNVGRGRRHVVGHTESVDTVEYEAVFVKLIVCGIGYV